MKEVLKAMMSSPVIAFRSEYARIAGGVSGGLFLSQALYWQSKMGDKWWYKTDEDWWEECCLSRRNLVSARKVLVAKGLLETDLRGVPARTYYRVNVDHVIEALSSLCETHNLGCTERTNKGVRNAQTITEEKAVDKAGEVLPPEAQVVEVEKEEDREPDRPRLSKVSASTIMEKWSTAQTVDEVVAKYAGTVPKQGTVSLFFRKAIAAAGGARVHSLPRKVEMQLLKTAEGIGAEWPRVFGTTIQHWSVFRSYLKQEGIPVGEAPTALRMAGLREHMVAFAKTMEAAPSRGASRGGGSITRARARRDGDDDRQ